MTSCFKLVYGDPLKRNDEERSIEDSKNNDKRKTDERRVPIDSTHTR